MGQLNTEGSRVDVLIHAGDETQHIQGVGDVLDTTEGFQVVDHDGEHLTTIHSPAELKIDRQPGVDTYIFYPTQEDTNADH